MPETPRFPRHIGREGTAGTSTQKHPATPISAGAFAFSFSTPAGPPPNKKQKTTDKNSTPLSAAIPPIFSVSKKAIESSDDVFLNTPRKPISSLGSLPSPFNRLPVRPSPQHKPLSAVMDEQSPFRTKSVKTEEDRVVESKEVRLGDLQQANVVDIPKERVKLDDEGIGVSPRKSKGLKWTGHGPPPPSFQLANLLSTASISLLLFYNPLQRMLFSPIRQNTSASTKDFLSKVSPPTPLQHIQTAAMIFRTTSKVYERTHQGVVLQCKIISHNTSIQGPSRIVEGLDAPSETGEESTVMLVLQPVPRECPKLGVDPKVVQGKLEERTYKQWEIGLWSPFTETSLRERESEEQSEQNVTRVIFASRYLVAQCVE